ncbi:MAG TPA: glycosyltransferase family 4 protein [Vicinamibacterales bacterium]|nr:glycosyltransferase family 4 protein [Vicinamibacterales bacterium]
MPVRILNVVRFPIGGIRSYLRYTYSQLDTEAYSSTVLTIDLPEARLLQTGMAPLAVDLVTVPVRQATRGLAVAAHGLVRTRQFGLVHSQGTTAALVSAPSARLYGVPHIVTLHETFRADQFSGLLGEAKRRILAQVFSRVHGVITVSRDARQNLLQHIPLRAEAADRVQVIRNGVSVNRLVQESIEFAPHLRARWQIEPGVVVLGFIGRFMPEKGFGVLVEAVRRLRERAQQLPRFVVVAVNDGAFVREYKQQISDWGLESSFIFTGFQATAAGTLTELDAVIMPSLREACPLVAMEAMVLGCPLIASDCLGLRELTAGSPSLQSVAGDSASLAEAMERFLLSRPAVRELATSYVEAARLAFDSSRAAESLTALFASVLEPASGRRVK